MFAIMLTREAHNNNNNNNDDISDNEKCLGIHKQSNIHEADVFLF